MKAEHIRTRRAAGGDAQSSDRRLQILEVAGRLFAEYGYEATSVRHIADAVNILPGSLYHHFTTKEDMLHGVVRAHLAEMVRDNRDISLWTADAEHKLVASVILRFRQYVSNWAFHSVLVQEGRFFRRNEDFAYVVEAKSQAFDIQQAILQEGMQGGLFHADLDTYLMIGTISRMLTSAASWFRAGDIFSAHRPAHYALDTMIDFHLGCILRMLRRPERLGEPIPRGTCEALLNAPA
ncbi:MAG: TetR/AcrR family transcriptional regulator [Sphingobium sp.]